MSTQQESPSAEAVSTFLLSGLRNGRIGLADLFVNQKFEIVNDLNGSNESQFCKWIPEEPWGETLVATVIEAFPSDLQIHSGGEVHLEHINPAFAKLQKKMPGWIYKGMRYYSMRSQCNLNNKDARYRFRKEEFDGYTYHSHTEESRAWLHNDELPHQPFDWNSLQLGEGLRKPASTRETTSPAPEWSFRSFGRKSWSSLTSPSSMRRSKAKEPHSDGAGGISSTLTPSTELSANHTS